MDLSIIIPAYNEERRLGQTLRAVLAYLERQPCSAEIIVVDDGSQDGTAQVAASFSGHKPRVQLLRNSRNRGKGYSVRKGFLRAKGKHLLFSDADLSTPIEELGMLIAALRNGYDIAIGSRALPESQIEVNQPWYRQNMGRLFNILVQALILQGIRDTQCGFKCFTREAAVDICHRMRCERFAFDVEMLYLAQVMGYRVAEVPVIWRNSPETKVHAIRDSAAMFADLLAIRSNHFRGRYAVGRAVSREITA